MVSFLDGVPFFHFFFILIFLIFYIFIFKILFFNFLIFFIFSFFSFFIFLFFYFLFLFIFFDDVITHPLLPLSFLPSPHPPLPSFFPLALPKIPDNSRTLADAFRRFSEDPLHQSEARTSVTSYSENWVKRVPCVKLMRFWVL